MNLKFPLSKYIKLIKPQVPLATTPLYPKSALLYLLEGTKLSQSM